MAKNFSQRKGSNGEREVIKLLQPVVNRAYAKAGLEPPALERNLTQSRGGGYDIVGLEWLALEIKRQENLNISNWWVQCRVQCKKNQVPVLMFRQNRTKWKVKMFIRIPIGPDGAGGWHRSPAILKLEEFLIYFEKRVFHEISFRVDPE